MAGFCRKIGEKSVEITFVLLPLYRVANFSCNKVDGKCV